MSGTKRGKTAAEIHGQTPLPRLLPGAKLRIQNRARNTLGRVYCRRGIYGACKNQSCK